MVVCKLDKLVKIWFGWRLCKVGILLVKLFVFGSCVFGKWCFSLFNFMFRRLVKY